MVKQMNNIKALPLLNSDGDGKLTFCSFCLSICSMRALNDEFDESITSEDEHDNDDGIDDELDDVDLEDLSEVDEFEKVFVNASSFSRFVHGSSYVVELRSEIEPEQ